MVVLDELVYFALCLIPGAVLRALIETDSGILSMGALMLPYVVTLGVRALVKARTGETLSQNLRNKADRWLPYFGGGTFVKLRTGQTQSWNLGNSGQSKSYPTAMDRDNKERAWAKVVDLLCFVAGPVLVVVNAISYSTERLEPRYSDTQLLFIGIGVALVAFGFLRKYWGTEREK